MGIAWAIVAWLFFMLSLLSTPNEPHRSVAEFWPEPNPGSEECLAAHMSGTRWRKTDAVVIGVPGVSMIANSEPMAIYHGCIDGTYTRALTP